MSPPIGERFCHALPCSDDAMDLQGNQPELEPSLSDATNSASLESFAFLSEGRSSEDSPDSTSSSVTSTASTASSGSSTNDESPSRMERWQARKLARKQRRRATEKNYGVLARSARMACQPCDDSDVRSSAEELPFVFFELLGAGSFAKVYRGAWVPNASGCPSEMNSGQSIAIKCMRPQRSRSDLDYTRRPKWLDREIRLSPALDHPKLVRVFKAFTETQTTMIVMEYCAGGSLYELIHGQSGDQPKPRLDRLTWIQRLKIATDIAEGMEYIHDAGMMHRDLKTPNILLQSSIASLEDVPVAKIGDFGLMRPVSNDKVDNDPGYFDDFEHGLSRQVGSWFYMAPEVYDDQGAEYNEKVDVYSFAMILYELTSDEIPFGYLKYSGRMRLGILVSMGERPQVKSDFQERIPQVFCDLMERCWRGEAEERPSFRSILEDLVNMSTTEPACAAERAPSRLDTPEAKPDQGAAESQCEELHIRSLSCTQDLQKPTRGVTASTVLRILETCMPCIGLSHHSHC